MIFVILILSLFSSCSAKPSNLLPSYDNRCNAMKCNHAEIDIREKDYLYFNREVPRIINQIWFGDKNKMPKSKVDEWKNYSLIHEYEYKLWSEEDLDAIRQLCCNNIYDYIIYFIQTKNYTAASDLVRCILLGKYGGIYIDCDINPPAFEGHYIDFAEFCSMKGLTVVTENDARNIRESAIFVCNGILISCPDHPVIRSMNDQFEKNINNWYIKNYNYDAMFITGPFMLNKVLFGNFSVLPITYIKYLGMF